MDQKSVMLENELDKVDSFIEDEGIHLFFRYLNLAQFSIRTIEDAELISITLAQLYPYPQKVTLGILEILINAIEHGNLGITYEEKTALNMTGQWKDEIKKRLALPENRYKEVQISFVKKEEEIILVVKDQGQGFDYTKYLDFDLERGKHNHGRGIAFARSFSFDQLKYVGNGNEVHCIIKLYSQDE